MRFDHLSFSGAGPAGSEGPATTGHAGPPLRPTALSQIQIDRKPDVTPPATGNGDSRPGQRVRRRWPVALVVVILFVVALVATGVWGYRKAQATRATYRDVTIDVHSLESIRSANFSTYTAADADRVHGQFVQLKADVDRLDSETSVPAPLRSLLLKLPYVGPRYEAGRQVINVVQLLSDSGVQASEIGQQTLQAYTVTGLSSSSESASPTWLDVIDQNMPRIKQIKDQVDQALQLRAGIDESVLPQSAQSKLDELDQLASSHDLNKLIDTQLPSIQAAFGGDGPARYLVLIQNPSELRPGGGFPGTIALVTFDRGQLRSYEFYDVYDLNQAYTTNPHQPVPQPWPLAKYATSSELSIPDAAWWSDFPTSAATIMTMYQSTGWPSIKGVVAIDPAVVGAMLKISGPMTIDVDGEMRTITSENVHDEIERQRMLQREGEKTEDVHKQVVAIIGQKLIDQLKTGDRSTMLNMVKAIKQTANQRDLQIYSSDQIVQALIDKRGWAGRLEPNGDTSTLSITFANVAFGKSSEMMEPSYTLTLDPASGGKQTAHLVIKMVHTGSPNDDPFYSGFQRWWVDVTLPSLSQRIGSSIADVPNPDEPNGGSYEVPLMPSTSTSFSIDFTMPASAAIEFRRQPGLRDAQVSVVGQSCDGAADPKTLSSDMTFSLSDLCAAP